MHHSQKLSQPALLPWVAVQDDGTILSGHCTCMAGLGEVCSHVAAVLFTLEEAVKIADGTSCTSLPCSWSRGSNKPLEYCPGSEIKFIRPARKKQRPDALPYGQRQCPYIPPASDTKTNNLYLELSKVYPCAALAGRPGFSLATRPTPNLDLEFPLQLSSLYNIRYESMTLSQLMHECELAFDSLVVDKTQVRNEI